MKNFFLKIYINLHKKITNFINFFIFKKYNEITKKKNIDLEWKLWKEKFSITYKSNYKDNTFLGKILFIFFNIPKIIGFIIIGVLYYYNNYYLNLIFETISFEIKVILEWLDYISLPKERKNSYIELFLADRKKVYTEMLEDLKTFGVNLYNIWLPYYKTLTIKYIISIYKNTIILLKVTYKNIYLYITEIVSWSYITITSIDYVTPMETAWKYIKPYYDALVAYNERQDALGEHPWHYKFTRIIEIKLPSKDTIIVFIVALITVAFTYTVAIGFVLYSFIDLFIPITDTIFAGVYKVWMLLFDKHWIYITDLIHHYWIIFKKIMYKEWIRFATWFVETDFDKLWEIKVTNRINSIIKSVTNFFDKIDEMANKVAKFFEPESSSSIDKNKKNDK